MQSLSPLNNSKITKRALLEARPTNSPFQATFCKLNITYNRKKSRTARPSEIDSVLCGLIFYISLSSLRSPYSIKSVIFAIRSEDSLKIIKHSPAYLPKAELKTFSIKAFIKTNRIGKNGFFCHLFTVILPF